MVKSVYLVYQDCIHCPNMEKWYDNELKLAKKLKIKVLELPFYHEIVVEGDFAKKAAKLGIKTFPFYVDGEKIATNLAALTKNDEETPKSVQKPKNKRKVKSNGDNIKNK